MPPAPTPIPSEQGEGQQEAGSEAGMDAPSPIAQLRDRRIACGLSHAEAAALSGVSASTIKVAEGPQGRITEKTLRALQHGLALSIPPAGGYHWDPENPESFIRPVLTAESVRSIADALFPLLDSGVLAGERAMIDYHAVVDALGSNDPKPPPALTSFLVVVSDRLPPEKLAALRSDIESRFGSTKTLIETANAVLASVDVRAATAGFTGSRPHLGPTPNTIGAILNSGLPRDTQAKLFEWAVKRHVDATEAVERELELLIASLRDLGK